MTLLLITLLLLLLLLTSKLLLLLLELFDILANYLQFLCAVHEKLWPVHGYAVF